MIYFFWCYTRHTSSFLGVAFISSTESHSLSMLIFLRNSAPTRNANYFGYINIRFDSQTVFVSAVNIIWIREMNRIVHRHKKVEVNDLIIVWLYSGMGLTSQLILILKTGILMPTLK